MQNFYQFIDISHVESDGRFVKNVNRFRQLAAALADVILNFGELGDELDTLGLTARQRGSWLAQRKIAQTQFMQRGKLRLDRFDIS